MANPKFQQLWVAANRFAHGQLIAALNGDTTTLQTSNGHVVPNLVPLLNATLKQIQSEASGLFGKKITLPAVTGTGIPAADCAKIAAALRRLPPNCGQIALFPARGQAVVSWW